MTLNDLNIGQVALRRDGNYVILLINNEGDKRFYNPFNEWKKIDIEDYESDLTYRFVDNKYDIMKVYEFDNITQALRCVTKQNLNQLDYHLVYERENEKEEKLNKLIENLTEQLTNAKQELKELKGE